MERHNSFSLQFMIRKAAFIIALILIGTFHLKAQKTSFGFSIKPIFASKYFRTGTKDFATDNIGFSILQKSGFSAGAIVRARVNNRLSIETGIQFVKRNYDLGITDSSSEINSSFKITGYEIPVSAITFIQLGDRIYMSAALGASIDIYPSDVETYAEDKSFLHYSARKSKVNPGIIGNLGIEMRTKKSGILYFGINYHRSFSTIYQTFVQYYRDRDFQKDYTTKAYTTLEGDYFAIDFRYYFAEGNNKKSNVQQY